MKSVSFVLAGVLLAMLGRPAEMTSPRAPVHLEKALQISVSSQRNGKLLPREEFRLTVRRKEGDWVLWFESLPPVHGEDVTVIVHADGEATVVPGL
jgi:hypothetical protein